MFFTATISTIIVAMTVAIAMMTMMTTVMMTVIMMMMMMMKEAYFYGQHYPEHHVSLPLQGPPPRKQDSPNVNAAQSCDSGWTAENIVFDCFFDPCLSVF